MSSHFSRYRDGLLGALLVRVDLADALQHLDGDALALLQTGEEAADSTALEAIRGMSRR
jgi:hypothetical protein